jgi:integrase/recombinase XerD
MMGTVQIRGPLGVHRDGFAAELARLGFTPLSADLQLRVAAHLSRWMEAAGLGVQSLTDQVAGLFLAARRASGKTAYLTAKSLVPLLDYLRRIGAAPPPAVVAPAAPAEELLARFAGWLAGERGLAPEAVRGYVDSVRGFAAVRAGRLAETAAGDVTAFMVAESGRLAPKTVQRTATALRSLLRFWHLEGLAGGSLDQAVPKVAYRSPGLPRCLEPAQVRALLASCDRRSPAGRRDYAILILLARMGLRAGEVAALTLEDIDWRNGEVAVRGKGNRRDKLPLPADAGVAVAEWLRDGRPPGALDRCVFIRIKAPHRGLTGGGITQVVAAAARRAGLGVIFAHRLRHSAATAVLTGGGSLEEIGQLLRHRRPATTASYTKVDVEALRALARPWPAAS